MGFKKNEVVALVSGTVVLVVLGSLYTFGSLTPYIYSYLYYQHSEVSLVALSVLFTTAIIMINVGMALSTSFLQRFSNQRVCVFSIVCVSLAVFVSSFMTTFAGFVVFYGVIYGASIGIGYLAPVKNAYSHLPSRKGLCAGVCMSGFGFGSFIFNQIIVQLVNPNDMKADSNNRFPESIANNVPFTLKVLSAVYLGMGLVASYFVQPPKPIQPLIPSDSIITSQNSILIDQEFAQASAEQNDKTSQGRENLKTTQGRENLSPMQVFMEKRAYLLILQYSLVVPFGLFTAFNYKELAFYLNPYFKEHDHLITIIGSVGILANGLFRSAWGYLFDKIAFQRLILAISIVLLFCCSTILFAVHSFPLYFLVITLNYLAYGGTFALLPTQAVRLMGPVAGSKLFWIIFSGFSISAALQFAIHYFIITSYGKEGFKYCIIIFLVLESLGVLLAVLIKYKCSEQEIDLMKKNLN